MSKEKQASVADDIIKKLFTNLDEIRQLKLDDKNANKIEKLIIEKEELLKQLRAVLQQKNKKILGDDNL
jgi:hypothetical protein